MDTRDVTLVIAGTYPRGGAWPRRAGKKDGIMITVHMDGRTLGTITEPRLRARGIDEMAAIVEAANEDRCLVRSGGAVANNYGYPAETEGAVVVPVGDREVYLAAARLWANKATSSGVVATCMGDDYRATVDERYRVEDRPAAWERLREHARRIVAGEIASEATPRFRFEVLEPADLEAIGPEGGDDRLTILHPVVAARSAEGVLVRDTIGQPRPRSRAVVQVLVRDATTGQRHAITVPPRFGRLLPDASPEQQAAMVHAAIAWTFRLRPEAYRPAVSA